ncbi:hypothetical protein ABZ942_32650 [Nocardia sp. NPDC046473]|uniref:hypothetical protein n=1 Tax=Nocardia sp. NPDC046473 TaxID=3155733 RepID=UPI0033E656D1
MTEQYSPRPVSGRRPALAVAVLAVGAILGVTACTDTVESAASPAAQATTAAGPSIFREYDTDHGRDKMVTTAKEIITEQVGRGGQAVADFGGAKFPDPLHVVLSSTLVDRDGKMLTRWFKVTFIGLAGQAIAVPGAKVALTERDFDL